VLTSATRFMRSSKRYEKPSNSDSAKKITDYDDALDRDHLMFGRGFLSAANSDRIDPRREARHSIFLINLILGRTILGWLAAWSGRV
jgi:hypothetical protein